MHCVIVFRRSVLWTDFRLHLADAGLTYSYTSKPGQQEERLDLGSTATDLVRGARCTVLITKGEVNGMAEGMYTE